MEAKHGDTFADVGHGQVSALAPDNCACAAGLRRRGLVVGQ
jgi:hypothetical protein